MVASVRRKGLNAYFTRTASNKCADVYSCYALPAKASQVRVAGLNPSEDVFGDLNTVL